MTADRIIRWSAAGAVLLVAAIAAVVSFVHIQHLALTHGQAPLAACLLPLSIDGTVAASMVMLRAARSGLGTPHLARFMLALAVITTLACNVGYGLPFGAAGALLSGWPAVAFLGCTEMAIGMVRRARVTDAPGATVPTVPPDNVPVTTVPTVPVPRTTKPGASRGRARKPSAKRSAATPEHAQRVFADVLGSGQLPSLRTIKTTMHVGTVRARELRAHLAEPVETQNVA